MSGKFQIAVVLFMLIEAVVLSAGTFAVFATTLETNAATLMPVIFLAGTALAAAAAWLLAPLVDTRVPAYRFA